MKNYTTEQLILRLAKIYSLTTKKALTEGEKIAKELHRRGVIKDIEYFVTEWRK